MSADDGFTLLGGRVRMAPMARGLKPTTDAVMLAAAADPAPGARVLDAGSGAGAVGLCLLARCSGLHVTALEREVEMVQLARRNVCANGQGATMDVVAGDLSDAAAVPGPFDLVLTNPPYLDPATSRPPADPLRAAAMVETMPLEDWIAACLRRLAPDGTLLIVHRPDRLAAITAALEAAGFVAAVRPLPSRADAAQAEMIIVRGVSRGQRGRHTAEPPLVMHDTNGAYTEAAEAVLRHGASLPWSKMDLS